MAEEKLEELVVVDLADWPIIRSRAAEAGVDLVEQERRAVATITTITLLIVGSAAAVRSVVSSVEQLKGGQVIDLRPDAPTMLSRSRGLHYGIIVIIHADGRVRVDLSQLGVNKLRDSVQTLLSVLSRSSTGGIEQVTSIVRDELGTDVPISPESESTN